MTMQNASHSWTMRLNVSISSKDWKQLILDLEAQKTKHANTAPKSIKDRAISLILASYSANERLQIAQFLSNSACDSAKEIGITLLSEFYVEHVELVEKLILKLGNDENWEVREWVANCLETIICSNPSESSKFLNLLVASRFPRLRRTAAVAIGYASRCTSPEAFSKLLRLLNVLLYDEDQYVKKNLAPFAIGAYAIFYKRQITCEWLLEMLNHEDDRVLSSLGLVLTTAAGADSLETLTPILQQILSRKERKSIQRISNKILKNLQNRYPNTLEKILKDFENSLHYE